MSGEIWKDVVGYEGLYQVSNKGKVRSVDREVKYSDGRVYFYKSKILKTTIAIRHGYKMLALNKLGRPKTFLVHRLVALSFVKNKDQKKYDIVNHLDGDKLNNDSTNLEWCDKSINMIHALDTMDLKHCYGEGHYHTKFTAKDALSIYEKVHNGYSAYKLAKEYGVNHQTIYNIKNGTTWKRITKHE